jgi:hypothetical protein
VNPVKSVKVTEAFLLAAPILAKRGTARGMLPVHSRIERKPRDAVRLSRGQTAAQGFLLLNRPSGGGRLGAAERNDRGEKHEEFAFGTEEAQRHAMTGSTSRGSSTQATLLGGYSRSTPIQSTFGPRRAASARAEPMTISLPVAIWQGRGVGLSGGSGLAMTVPVKAGLCHCAGSGARRIAGLVSAIGDDRGLPELSGVCKYLACYL